MMGPEWYDPNVKVKGIAVVTRLLFDPCEGGQTTYSFSTARAAQESRFQEEPHRTIMYEQEKSEIQILRAYLLSQVPATPLPPSDVLLSPNSVALKAAVAGLDKELARLEREERLVKKFAATTNCDAATMEVGGGSNGGNADDDAADMEYVKMSKEDAPAATKGGDCAVEGGEDEEEWEEAGPAPSKKHARQEEQAEDENAALCRELASSAVAKIASANVKVNTALGALGLALHSALMELTGGDGKDRLFRCTGVPDATVTAQLLGSAVAKGGGGGGFAPPVRELPRGQLIPPKWEEKAEPRAGGVIAFRYKCGKGVYSVDLGHTSDATTVYLALRFLSGSEVAVAFGALPSSADKSDVKQLKFELGKHVNLDGFAAAKAKNGGGAVPPSLFYISLSDLLMKFNSSFGVVTTAPKGEGSPIGMQIMPTNVPVRSLPPMPDTAPAAKTHLEQIRPSNPPFGAVVDPLSNITDPLLAASSQQRGKRGDFDADLLPGGPQPGGLHGVPPRGGSQVGPDHPMFDRTFGQEDGHGNFEDDLGFGGGGGFGIPGVGGGMGMRPRYVSARLRPWCLLLTRAHGDFSSLPISFADNNADLTPTVRPEDPRNRQGEGGVSSRAAAVVWGADEGGVEGGEGEAACLLEGLAIPIQTTWLLLVAITSVELEFSSGITCWNEEVADKLIWESSWDAILVVKLPDIDCNIGFVF